MKRLSSSIFVVMTMIAMLTVVQRVDAFVLSPCTFITASRSTQQQHQKYQQKKNHNLHLTSSYSVSQLFMANDEDMMRWARSSRSASANDRVVELKRPLGLVLAEDDNGNVYVETIAPKGNAARAGGVRVSCVCHVCHVCVDCNFFVGFYVELEQSRFHIIYWRQWQGCEFIFCTIYRSLTQKQPRLSLSLSLSIIGVLFPPFPPFLGFGCCFSTKP